MVPFDSKQWERVKYRGGYLIGIKQHKVVRQRFMYEVNIKQFRRRKFVIIHEQGAERYQLAMEQYAAFKADIRAGYCIDAHTFDEMFIRMMSIKRVTQRWHDLQVATYHNHIAAYLGTMNVQDIRAQHIDTVKAAARGMAPASIKAIIDIVKATLRHALEDKIIKALPLESRHDVKVIAAQQKIIVTDAAKKFAAVHQAINSEFVHDSVMRGVFLFGLYGRRKAEIWRMRWEHIDFNKGRYMIPGEHSKVKTDFEFSLPNEVAETLRKIKGRRRGLVFKNQRTGKELTNIQPQIEKIRLASGWERFTFHAMRNLLASMLHSRGVSSSYISSVLGHTNPITVQQYLSMERVQPLIEKEVNSVVYGVAMTDNSIKKIEQRKALDSFSIEVKKALR